MADNDTAEVRLTAQTDPLKSGVDAAAAAVARAFRSMREAITGLGADSRRTSDQVAADTARIGNAAKSAADAVGGSFAAIGAGMRTAIAGGIAAVGAAIGIKAGIDNMSALKDEVEALERVMGLANGKATEMAIALRLAGSSAREYTGMAMNISRELRSGGEAFDRLKVKVHDASGAFLPMDEILQNVYTRMQDFRAGADQNQFALDIVGRSALEFGKVMEDLEAVGGRAAEMMRDLGVEMGPEQKAKVQAFSIEVRAFQQTLGAVAMKIGEAAMPSLLKLAQYFNEAGPTAIGYMLDAGKGLLTAFDAIATGARAVYLSVRASFENMGTAISSVWEALKGPASEFLATVRRGNAEIVRNNAETTAAITKLWTDSRSRISNLWIDDPATRRRTALAPGSGNERYAAKNSGGGATPSRLGEWEAELKRQQNAFDTAKLQQNSFETWSLQQTAAYWDAIRDRQDLSEKERAQVEIRYYDAVRQLRQKDFAAYLAALDAEKEALGHNIQAKIAIQEREAAAIEERLGKDDPRTQEAYRKLVKLRNDLKDQRVRIAEVEAAAVAATERYAFDMAKLDIDQQLALRKITKEQALSLEQQYLDRLFAIEAKAIRDRIALAESNPNSDPVKLASLKGQLLAIEQDHQQRVTDLVHRSEQERAQASIAATQAVQDSFATMLSDVATGSKSLRDSVLDAFRAIERAIADIAAKKIAQTLFGPGTAGGSALDSFFGSLFGLPSFDVGTAYVPRDMVAVVHQGERIVPASENRPGGAGGVVQHVTFNLAGAVDGRTQHQILSTLTRAAQIAVQRR